MTVRMGVIEDFDNLSKDAQEYLKRRVEGVKMGVVEERFYKDKDGKIWMTFIIKDQAAAERYLYKG